MGRSGALIRIGDLKLPSYLNNQSVSVIVISDSFSRLIVSDLVNRLITSNPLPNTLSDENLIM